MRYFRNKLTRPSVVVVISRLGTASQIRRSASMSSGFCMKKLAPAQSASSLSATLCEPEQMPMIVSLKKFS